jgi:hypothetical protein
MLETGISTQGDSMNEKEKVIEQLNQILQIRDVPWGLLPESDLLRLFEAFLRLKEEVEQVFALFDEITEVSLVPCEDGKKEWRHYCV